MSPHSLTSCDATRTPMVLCPLLTTNPMNFSSAVQPESDGHSVIHHPVSINGEPLSADQSSPKEDRFAVVELSGSQFKVTIVHLYLFIILTKKYIHYSPSLTLFLLQCV